MFTGLVQEVGVISRVVKNSSGKEFQVGCKDLLADIKVNDSISINGVCLTATAVLPTGFVAQAVNVTLQKTNLGQLAASEKVNLELAMKYSDRVGGHFVQGHVNGIATLINNSSHGENHELWFVVEPEFQKYIYKEGSIALDGISLTIADIRDDKFMVSIIPHTWSQTQIHTRMIGDQLNLEVDMMAKMMANYVDKYLAAISYGAVELKRESNVTI